MDAKVIYMDEYRPHDVTNCLCKACGKHVVSVALVGSEYPRECSCGAISLFPMSLEQRLVKNYAAMEALDYLHSLGLSSEQVVEAYENYQEWE
jgi:hypothetical protein